MVRYLAVAAEVRLRLLIVHVQVGILAINGDRASEEQHGEGLLRFVVTFVMSWKIWADVQQIVSWFETNDVVQRIQVLFVISCLLG